MDAVRASTSEKSEQAGVIEGADDNPCDILTAQSGKGKYSMLIYLTRGPHTTCAKKGSGSAHTSFLMKALS